VVAVAAFLPWVTSVDVKGVSQVLGGFDGAADGFIEFLVGGGLLAVLASRGAQTSRVRTVQLLPAILGSVCLFGGLDASVRVARAIPLSYDASEPPVLHREFGALLVVGVVGFLVGVGAGPLLA